MSKQVFISSVLLIFAFITARSLPNISNMYIADFKITKNNKNVHEFNSTYYVSSSIGDDKNNGQSIKTAWKSLSRVNDAKLNAGDKILFRSSDIFEGSLILKNIKGTEKEPVMVSSFQVKDKKRAIIDAKNHPNGIKLINCNHVSLQNLIIKANPDKNKNEGTLNSKMRCGVLVMISKPGSYSGIKLENLLIKDIYYESYGYNRGDEEVKSPNGTQNYGWGIRFINRTKNAILSDVLVQNCEVKNVAHTGLKFTGNKHNINNIKVIDNILKETGGPGIQMSGVKNSHIKNNSVNYSGSNNDSRKWGRGSGLWTWGCSDILIEHNSFQNANGPGDSAGCHIDFNCKNVVVQYNYSANNAGGFCEILGNNYNCAYRYNISVNDGYRTKGQNGAFQDGKTLWLSGYVGKNKERKGPFNTYIYNNTIYVNKDITSKMALAKTAKGILIVNNIFYIEGKSKSVKGDQYNPEKDGIFKIKNSFFKNNLLLKTSNWPKEVIIQKGDQMVGDPLFKNKKGNNIADFTPTNSELIKNKGIEINKLPEDSLGLKRDLKVTFDILGNKIIDKPDLGAIELH